MSIDMKVKKAGPKGDPKKDRMIKRFSRLAISCTRLLLPNARPLHQSSQDLVS